MENTVSDKKLFRKEKSGKTAQAEAVPEKKKSERLISLDVFRGVTIAGMILVNNPGSWSHIYPALEHAKWHGVTPTDLIFPFFLFIVGVAIALSLSKRKERGDDHTKLILQVFRRGITLFVLGLALASFPYVGYDFSKIRIPGVLQRIGVVYIIASLLFLKTSDRSRMIISWVILIGYWAAMTLIPVPGVGYPNFEPATNIGAWLDNLLLGGHLWSATKVWDPEGLMSTIPAIATALFGIQTGKWLMGDKDKTVKTVWMFFTGNAALVLAMIWDMWFPLNKGLWSSSYVIYCAGMALQFLAMCYWIIDVKGYTKWAKPFLVYGTNAITVFFLSGIMARGLTLIKWTDEMGKAVTLKGYLYASFYESWLSPINASLAWALTYVILWLGLMWILYAKKIFIKI